MTPVGTDGRYDAIPTAMMMSAGATAWAHPGPRSQAAPSRRMQARAALHGPGSNVTEAISTRESITIWNLRGVDRA